MKGSSYSSDYSQRASRLFTMEMSLVRQELMTGQNQTNRRDFDWKELEAQKADNNSIYKHYKTMLSIRNAYTDVFAKREAEMLWQVLMRGRL